MELLDRRSFIECLSATLATLSGCQALRQSAGTLIIRNEDNLPHIVDLTVITYWPDDEEVLNKEHGQIDIDPGETKRYTEFLDVSKDHLIISTLKHSKPVRVPYGRKGVSTNDNLVFIKITRSGHLTGGIQTV